jgi:CheY-like chemotaxis protein
MTNKNFILLVEDNQDDIDLILRSLKKGNIANDVIVARDGVAALDFLFGSGEYAERDVSMLPTVILLDIKMPRMDGIQVLERIRADERTEQLPVVLLTSSNEEQDLVKGYHFGANSYVRKPVDFGEFSEVVRQLGLYWLLLNEAPLLKKSNKNTP